MDSSKCYTKNNAICERYGLMKCTMKLQKLHTLVDGENSRDDQLMGILYV